MTARIPVMGHHESVNFMSYTRVTNELDDTHHISLKPYYPKIKKSKRDLEDERRDKDDNESDGNLFDR